MNEMEYNNKTINNNNERKKQQQQIIGSKDQLSKSEKNQQKNQTIAIEHEKSPFVCDLIGITWFCTILLPIDLPVYWVFHVLAGSFPEIFQCWYLLIFNIDRRDNRYELWKLLFDDCAIFFLFSNSANCVDVIEIF